MNRLQSDNQDVARFLVIYISEAHAQDEWPLGKKVCVMKHQSLEDRLKVANVLKEEYHMQIPILVDTMKNTFDNLFASWPERFYILENGKMELIGFPTNEFGYDRGTLQNWLDYRRTKVYRNETSM